MSANDRRKKPEEEGEEIQRPAGGRRRQKAAYIDPKTGEEVFREEEAPELEEDEELIEDDEMPDLQAVEDGEEDEEEEIDPTPLDEAWVSYELHDDSVFTVKLRTGADGKVWMATGGGDEKGFLVEVGDGVARPEQGQVYGLEGHTDSVSRVAWSHDGAFVATAGMDALVKIWSAKDAELIATLEGPSESIESLEWHPKGPALLAGCGDGTAWVWEKNGTPIGVLAGHNGPVNIAKFTPDGKKVVTVGEDGSLRVWAPRTSSQTAIIQGHGFHDGGINALALHEDNTLALTGGQDNNAILSNMSTSKAKAVFAGHNDGVEDVAWAPHNPWAVTGSLDGRVGIWDLNTGTNRHFIENGIAGVLGVQVVENTIFTSDTAGYIRLWDLRSATLIRAIRASQDHILAFDVLPQFGIIATAGDDLFVKLYKIQA